MCIGGVAPFNSYLKVRDTTEILDILFLIPEIEIYHPKEIFLKFARSINGPLRKSLYPELNDIKAR